MEQIKSEKSNKLKPLTATTVSLRVKRDTKRRIIQELTKMNKKDFGKRIKADDLIGLALDLIEGKHIALLQEASLSNSDRLEILYREHIKKRGATSKDEFIGQLLDQKMTQKDLNVVSETTLNS